MNNFVIFIVGLVVTLIAGMGVITSTVFMGYNYIKENKQDAHSDQIYSRTT